MLLYFYSFFLEKGFQLFLDPFLDLPGALPTDAVFVGDCL